MAADSDLERLAAEPLDAADESVLSQVAALYDRLDPVPTGLTDRIRFGVTLDALHAEIARLGELRDLAGVRADSSIETRTITFTSENTSIMITVTRASAHRVRIDGWVVPADEGAVVVELRLGEGTRTETADEDGRFVFADVPRGHAQFVARHGDADGRRVVTPTIEI